MNYEDIWKMKLENVGKYIDVNNKLPSSIDKNESIKKLCNWLSRQKQNYTKKEKIMKTSSKICELWEEFQEKYSEYFISNEEQWKNKKLSSESNMNDSIKKLSCWIQKKKK
jgi:hypothetical protein